MTFFDNSDFAPLVSRGDEGKIVEIEDVERGEDFVQAGVGGLSLKNQFFIELLPAKLSACACPCT